MPELLIPFVNFAIALVIVLIVGLIVYLISKVTTFITTFAFYFFVCSLLLIAITNSVGVNYLNLYPTMGETIDMVIKYIAAPFIVTYTAFFEGIVGICGLFMDETPVRTFLLDSPNVIFVVCYQFSIFLISLILFKKEEKKDNDNSVYRE